jgi:hypothetical protein
LLYRQPAFLICSDPQLELTQIVQNYIWRWDIEVNFREEKTLLGVGQAQVRHAASTQAVPALQVASGVIHKYRYILIVGDATLEACHGA